MENCIFCKIIKKEIPAKLLFENDYVLTFLDINPDTNGHLLVIPKNHYEDIFSCPDDYLSEIVKELKKWSLVCRDKLGASAVNIVNNSGKDAGQDVFHLHFHLIPRYENSYMKLSFNKKMDNLMNVDDVYRSLLAS